MCPKRVFPVENRKNEHHDWILHDRIRSGTKFHFKQTNLIFWTKLTQNSYSWSKMKKVNITIEFCMFELDKIPNFSLNWQFWIFGPNLPRFIPNDAALASGTRYFSQKSENFENITFFPKWYYSVTKTPKALRKNASRGKRQHEEVLPK